MMDVKPGTMVACAACDGDGLRRVGTGESEVGAGECPACEGKGKLRAEADAAERGAFVVESALREMELRSRADDLARRLGEAEAALAELREAVERLARSGDMLVTDLVCAHFAVVATMEDGPVRMARGADPESAADALLSWHRSVKGGGERG
jgi:hypothetical protein